MLEAVKGWFGRSDKTELVEGLDRYLGAGSEISPENLAKGRVKFMGNRFSVESADRGEGLRLKIRHIQPDIECEIDRKGGLTKVVFLKNHRQVFEADKNEGAEWSMRIVKGWTLEKLKAEWKRFMVSCDFQATPSSPLSVRTGDNPKIWHYLLDHAAEMARKTGVLQVKNLGYGQVEILDGYGESIKTIAHQTLGDAEAGPEARHLLFKLNGGNTTPGFN